MYVSIAVVSYNSENTILQTLNSIVRQDYGSNKLELIISDDASVDNTIPIVDQWLDENKYKFHNIRFIKNSVNQGVSKNCNIAWKACASAWIKTIAADDILLPNCIRDNVDYIRLNPGVKALFSYMIPFDNLTGNTLEKLPETINIEFYNWSPEKQYKILLKESFNMAPTSFLEKTSLEMVGYADERFKLIEDLPLWLKFTHAGIPLRFMPITTVKYRIGNSLTSSSKDFIHLAFIKQMKKLNEEIIFPNLTGKDKIYIYTRRFDINSLLFISKITNNKKSLLSKIMLKSTYFLRPDWYLKKLKLIKKKGVK